MPVLIMHGWSDNYESFIPLKSWFAANGYRAEEVFLGNYESMEDHVTFDDLAVGLQVQLDALVAQKRLPPLTPFSLDVVVHSTGGPVFRHWLDYHLSEICGGDAARNPIRTVIMLAPANFGSRLAAQGKSALAMLFKGGVAHGFQTGGRILEGLELGSPALWSMAHRDLFGSKSVYPIDPNRGPFVFVFSGTSTYGHLKGLVAKGANEDGSDGTVRAAAASLNSILLRANFLDPTDPRTEVVMQPNEPFAFRLVPDVDHTTLVPRDDAARHPLAALITQCLGVRNLDGYRVLAREFEAANDAFYAQERAKPGGGIGAYQQFLFRVRDRLGNDVSDYRVEFHVIDDAVTHSGWSDKGSLTNLQRFQEQTTVLQESVIADVQPHSVNASYRTFFLNVDRLEALQADLRKTAPNAYIAMNLNATGPTPDLTYNTDPLRYLRVEVPIPNGRPGERVSFFKRNTSTLVDIRISRIPTNRIFDFPSA